MRFLSCAYLMTTFSLCFSSCDSNNPNPVGVVLGPSQTRLIEGGIPFEVQVNLSAPASINEEVTIVINDSTSQYGREYTTQPEGSSKSFTLTVAKGSSTTSFLVIPKSNSGSDGNRSVIFGISQVSDRLRVSANSSKTVVTFLDVDLRLFLPFSGNSNDRSTYSNTVALSGASLVQDRSGITGSALSFDGLQNNLSVQNTGLLNPIYITVCAWIKPVSFTGVGNNTIIEKPFTSHSNPFYQYKLGITGDTYSNLPASFVFSLAVGGRNTVVTTNSNAWQANRWYFVVGTYDGDVMRLYVNGLQAAAQAVTGTIPNFSRDISVAKFGNLSHFTPGVIDDIRIYDRALSESEIQSLFLR